MPAIRTIVMAFAASFCWVSFCSADQPATDPFEISRRGDLRNEQLFLAKGYVSIPITRGDNSRWWYVNCTLNDKKFNLLLDSGATACTINVSTATELGIKPMPTGQSLPLIGNPAAELFQTINPHMQIGKLSTSYMPFIILDIGHLTRETRDEGIRPPAGLLGAPFFEWYSAVLDYSEHKLYLLDPLTPLQGRWQIKSIAHDGAAVRLKDTIELRVKGDRLNFDSIVDNVDYMLLVNNTVRPRVMSWTSSNGGILPARYQLEDGILTIAMPLLKPNPPYSLPDSLEGKPGCDFTVMTFERPPTP